ncbi:hypothetical protein IIA16_01980 [bacterium]|nr:hypothetical protein [bacterium]
MTQEPGGPLCAILWRERSEADIVIVEGFSRDAVRPRVEVLAPGRGPYLPPDEVDGSLVRGLPVTPLAQPWKPATTEGLLAFVAKLAPSRSPGETHGRGDSLERFRGADRQP